MEAAIIATSATMSHSICLLKYELSPRYEYIVTSPTSESTVAVIASVTSNPEKSVRKTRIVQKYALLQWHLWNNIDNRCAFFTERSTNRPIDAVELDYTRCSIVSVRAGSNIGKKDSIDSAPKTDSEKRDTRRPRGPAPRPRRRGRRPP